VHAVVGIWTMDETRRDEQDRLLRDQIVPLAKGHPGFVCGYWMQDPETGKGHTTIVFADRESASKYKAMIQAGTRRAAQAGVISDILTIVEVVAEDQACACRGCVPA
jgi:hypothetical protein